MYGFSRNGGGLLPRLALCAAALLGASVAHAAYPERPVRVIVPFAAGGGADIVARLVFKGVSEQLGKAFIIDNRGGAGGIIGTDAVAKAEPDGYTLLLGQSGPNAINPSVYSKLPYDARKDFAPVTQLTRYPYVVAVKKQLPVDNLKELIALAKRQPGTLTVSTAGQGSSAHLAIELFMRQAGISINAVPYKGAGPALLDVVGGTVDMTFGDAASASKQAQAKNVKAVAVTGAKRSPLLPDVPTVAEAGVPGYEASAWHGVLAPRGTPEPIIRTLQAAIVKVLADPALKARLAEDGIETVGSSPEEFNRALLAEIDKWHTVVVEANIKLE
ncbi:Bug family tripartite tricarboxylate transporter substrate binding protein [Achromobacter aloeverae]|uniref:Tripartite tricarboxylate transporter substrate binding protein n=1 Tax=Achromobacter aloeverae TaxID=1750518 RepID=A0A4Q1HFL5_9BURK|nr:tripartite tricarboxylate transporter substrate binding protein [Achromobacter aloeverae]RXN85358.1 tripartite tricarboxylate transporter substrate binding protein [Achromobacter aloeverae]